MRTFVTGATGFVGRHLIAEMLARGEEIKALVRDPKRVVDLRDRGIEVIVGDFRDPEALRAAVCGTEVVYHCAAASGGPGSEREARDANVAAARQLLEAVRQGGRGRVVLLSGLKVLGLRDLDPATEETPCRRSNDPGFETKLRIERLAWEYHGQHGVEVAIVRPGFIYGPGEVKHMPKLMEAIRRGKFAFIESQHNVVPIVHVDDAARALVLAGRATSANGRVYHITDGSRTTIGEFVSALSEHLGAPTPRRVLPYPLIRLACWIFERGGRWPRNGVGAPITREGLLFLGTSRFVDIRRAHEELGYVPQIVFPEGMAATLQSIIAQLHGKTDIPLSTV